LRVGGGSGSVQVGFAAATSQEALYKPATPLLRDPEAEWCKALVETDRPADVFCERGPCVWLPDDAHTV